MGAPFPVLRTPGCFVVFALCTEHIRGPHVPLSWNSQCSSDQLFPQLSTEMRILREDLWKQPSSAKQGNGHRKLLECTELKLFSSADDLRELQKCVTFPSLLFLSLGSPWQLLGGFKISAVVRCLWLGDSLWFSTACRFSKLLYLFEISFLLSVYDWSPFSSEMSSLKGWTTFPNSATIWGRRAQMHEPICALSHLNYNYTINTVYWA